MTNQLINHQPVHSRKDIQRIKYYFVLLCSLLTPPREGLALFVQVWILSSNGSFFIDRRSQVLRVFFIL